MQMPSIGNDLALIRNHEGYTIEDIQKATKLPLSTLHSIEDGTIFSEQREINTYIRSFVRTYGRAIKVDEDLLSRALDQEELGSYDNLLLQDYPEIRKEIGIETDPENEEDDVTEEKNKKSQQETNKKNKSPAWEFESDKVDKPKSPTTSRAPATPDIRKINWADIGDDRRKKSTHIPVWIISAGLIIILLITAAILITQFGLFSTDDENTDETNTEESATAADQNLSLDLSNQIPEDQTPAVALNDTLYLTVYAAYNRLDPVRVWSDLKPRIDPYWLDQGTAINYEFQDTIRVRGGYSNMLMFVNGNRIDDFRNQYFNDDQNAVELTRSLFNTDPQWATPVPLELPEEIAEPDTIMMRPSL